MNEPEEQRPGEESSRGGCLLIGVLLLALFYVLSPPVFVLILDLLPNSMAEPLMNVLEVVYYPLETAYEHINGVRSFYDWYMGLFDFR